MRSGRLIESIHAQLSAWGRWVHSPIKAAVGYPSHSAGFGDYLPPGVEYKSKPPAGVFSGKDAMEAINAAVLSISEVDRALCFEVYVVGPKSLLSVSERLHIPNRSLYRELHRVHEIISSRMSDGM
jgi:hypothetical protein